MNNYYYHYGKFELHGSISILRDGTVKFTEPAEFNDPFDSYPIASDEFPESLLKEYSANKGIVYFSPAEREHLIEVINKQIKDGTFWDAFRKDIGVFCVSANPLEMLMWSHYSDHHKGFIIEFELHEWDPPKAAASAPYTDSASPETRYTHLNVNKVKYSMQRPRIKSGTRDWVVDILCHKSHEWKYEHEYRVINMPSNSSADGNKLGPGISYFSFNKIKSVIVGALMPETHIEFLQYLVDKINHIENFSDTNAIRIYRAQLADNDYRVEIPGHPRAEQRARECREADQSDQSRQ